MKKYIIEVLVDEKKLRAASIEYEGASVEEMLHTEVQLKLDNQKWLSDYGITIDNVRPSRKPREPKYKPTPSIPGAYPFIPGGFTSLKKRTNDINWDED